MLHRSDHCRTSICALWVLQIVSQLSVFKSVSPGLTCFDLLSLYLAKRKKHSFFFPELQLLASTYNTDITLLAWRGYTAAQLDSTRPSDCVIQQRGSSSYSKAKERSPHCTYTSSASCYASPSLEYPCTVLLSSCHSVHTDVGITWARELYNRHAHGAVRTSAVIR